jgi:Holliday junction resolvasome RuvABC endonuclease subunit
VPTWGVDLGVRSLYVARIDGDELELFAHNSLRIHEQDRYVELSVLRAWLGMFSPAGTWYTEEPPLAGARNLQTFLHLSQTSGVVACCVPTALVPVSSWKKGTVGNGSASKDLVARWLSRRHPAFFEACAGDQNLVDATCIALYGKSLDQGGPGGRAAVESVAA